jgi:hypothetical protein
VAQAINAVTGTRLWLLSFLFLEDFDFVLPFCSLRSCRNRQSAAIVQRLVYFSGHPQVMQQHRQFSCRGHDGSLLAVSSTALRQFQSPASEITVDAEWSQDMLRSLHQQRPQIRISLFTRGWSTRPAGWRSYGERLRGCNVRNLDPEKADVLSPELQRALEPLLATIEELSERICEYNDRIEALAQASYPQVALLKQIKGVGTVWSERGVISLPVRVNVPVAGLYSSELLRASLDAVCPPATRALPFGSTVPVMAIRVALMAPVEVHVPVAGL